MHNYNSILIHCVFSTKERRPYLSSELRKRLWPYFGGTAHGVGLTALAAGGFEDHAHLLLSLPSTMSVAEAVQKLKANSSRWIKENFPTRNLFSWQKGYGCFSIGISQVADTIAYIKGQEEHHRRIDFRQEFEEFLKRHGMELQEDI